MKTIIEVPEDGTINMFEDGWTLNTDGIFACSIPLSKLEIQQTGQGKWIRNDNGTYSCDICQSWIPKEQHYYARYCLYCGTKMENKYE